MSHERDPVPAPEDSGEPVTTPLGLLDRVRRHVRTWPRRYVEMRVGKRP